MFITQLISGMSGKVQLGTRAFNAIWNGVSIGNALRGEVTPAQMEKLISRAKRIEEDIPYYILNDKNLFNNKLSQCKEGFVRKWIHKDSPVEPAFKYDLGYNRVYNIKNYSRTVVSEDGSMSRIFSNGTKVVIRKDGDKTIREVYLAHPSSEKDKVEWCSYMTNEKSISTEQIDGKVVKVKQSSTLYTDPHIQINSDIERTYQNNEFSGMKEVCSDAYLYTHNFTEHSPLKLKKITNYDKNKKPTDVRVFNPDNEDSTLLSFHYDENNNPVQDCAKRGMELHNWLKKKPGYWNTFRQYHS